MNYREIYKAKDLSKAFLFYGQEKLLMENALEYLINFYTDKTSRSFNLIYFKGEEVKTDDLKAACQTYPLMADKKIIVLKDAGEFLKENSLNDDFYKFLDGLAHFLILIFYAKDDILKTTKFFKYFQKNKRNIEFPKLNPLEGQKFVESYFIKKGKKIRPSEISYFLSLTGYNLKNSDLNLLDLKNEMDKIIAYAKDDFVKREDIENLLSESKDSNIFNFLDALYNRNPEKALIELNKLHETNEPMQRVFIMFARQVRLLLSYKELREKSYNPNDIMNKLDIKKFEFSKIRSYEKKFSKDFLVSFYYELLKSDEIFKSTSFDDMLEMESLVVKYSDRGKS
ncbi:DNA polymerase III subunit delta [Peptoniphilus raoultii]|uniref:DNA polymerase III subunit delta n=1 Tax=Peptoniphilus raoultii TaxID=1776387 RepID=UPI0008D941FA|nr:DNA polymerase III subunit delta [Peptoniphilus raoultii]